MKLSKGGAYPLLPSSTMTAPAWLTRELKLINPRLRFFYFERYRKWMIVRDYPKRIVGVTDYDPISGRNFVVEMVLEDENHNPLPLTGQSLETARECYYDHHSRPYSYYWHRLKKRQRAKEEAARKERELRFKDAGREIHKSMTTETFI